VLLNRLDPTNHHTHPTWLHPVNIPPETTLHRPPTLGTTYPVAPAQITDSHILTDYIRPLVLFPTNHPMTPQVPQPILQTKHTTSHNATDPIYNGLYTKQSRTSQAFTWIAAHYPHCIITVGKPQVFHSENCSSGRGDLIVLLQALNSIMSAPQIHLPQPIICTWQTRVLSMLKSTKGYYHTPTTMLREESGILQEILPKLKSFQSVHTHLHHKRDPESSTEKFLLT
jgi:hypothetical protein